MNINNHPKSRGKSRKQKNHKLTAISIAAAFGVALAAIMLFNPLASANVSELHNEHLFVRVQNDAKMPVYGGFMLKTGDNESLTYPQFYSSFATIKINGVVKKFSDGTPVSPIRVVDGTIIAVQNFDGVEITQRLSIVTGYSDEKNMLSAEYSVENKTNSNVAVAVRLLVDPTLDNSESGVVIAGGKSFTHETTLSGAQIPDTWHINNVDGKAAVFGIVSGASKPSAFQIADWENLYNNHFDYNTSADTLISDNAVAFTWDGTVNAGQAVQYSTRIGLFSEHLDVIGDVNLNGRIDTGDALEILKYIVRIPGAMIVEGNQSWRNALIVGTPPGTGDALEILKFIVKLENKIPPPLGVYDRTGGTSGTN